MKMPPKPQLVRIVISVVAAAAIIALIGYAFGAREEVPAPATSNAPMQDVQARQPEPLEIQAIRARQYPGSDITVEQEAGSRGSYRDQLISYQSDGLKIFAQASIPNAAAPSSGYPVIILDHGYVPPAQYQTLSADYRRWIDAFAAAGYVVVKPDYRGHAQSQGTPEGGHWSPAYAYDNLNLIASLKRWPVVNASRLGQVGHSMGAHVALRTAVVSKDVRATVAVSGVVGSLPDLVNNWPRSPMPNDQPHPVVTGARQKLVEQHGMPTDDSEFWRNSSAINYVADIAGPVQIHHGTADAEVPLYFSQRLDGALTAANKPHELFAYEGGDHQFTNAAYRQQMLQRALAMFATALAP